jgi:PAS domain S-box-containing protein
LLDESSAGAEASPEGSGDRRPSVFGGGYEMFYAAVQMSRMPMVLADPHRPDYPLIFCNQAFCRLTGYSESEVLGRNCRFLQGQLTDPSASGLLREALAAKTGAHVELWNYRKDGTPFWNSMFMSPVFNPEGRLLCSSAVRRTRPRLMEPRKPRREHDG